jgi:hypothetical protein
LNTDDTCSMTGPAPLSSSACCCDSGSARATASSCVASTAAAAAAVRAAAALLVLLLLLVAALVVAAAAVGAASPPLAARAACSVGCRLSRKPGMGMASDTCLQVGAHGCAQTACTAQRVSTQPCTRCTQPRTYGVCARTLQPSGAMAAALSLPPARK